MTNRTDELRNSGKTERRNVDGDRSDTPWIKWGDRYNWVDAKCMGFFETKYGLCVTLHVTDCYDGRGLKANGTNSEGEDYTVIVEPEMTVNLGLYSAVLQGKITTDDEGKYFHIAFEQWGESRGGNKFRMFTVIPLDPPKGAVEKVAEVLDAEVVKDDDDGLPF